MAQILTQLLPKMKFEDFILVAISESKLLASIQGFNFPLSKIQLQLIKCLRNQTLWKLDDLAFALWQEKWTESHYHRIRMMGYKLNKQLKQHLGYELVTISKNELRLNLIFKIE